ncbi:MAG TPA: hypothetical protein VE262_13890 [Blastocatellia bacterium]|nr:hypothetical protein [Blastocatellia bacterium]
MKKDKGFDPVEVSFFSTQAVVTCAQKRAGLIEELRHEGNSRRVRMSLGRII